jgi:hypothetical protein
MSHDSSLDKGLILYQLENALASDRRGAKWKQPTVSPDSDAELSETVPIRPRPPRGTKLVNKPPARKRARSGTASSTQSTPATQTDEGTVSPPAHPQRTVSSDTGNDTPTHTRSLSVTNEEQGTLEAQNHVCKISSEASLSAARPTSFTQMTPTTPSLTPGISVTTDDSDTDFQSAYSTSPRASYGSFESGDVRPPYTAGDDDDDGPTISEKSDRHGLHSDLKARRERVESSATAIILHDRAHPSPTFSEDTVISQGTSRRILANSIE